MNTNSRAAVNWLSLCRKSSDLEASDLVPAPIFSTRSNFLVRRDVQEGDDVVVFEQQLRTQEGAISVLTFVFNGQFPGPPFIYFCLLNKVKIYMKLATDWIRTADH